jgi:hypothetical protein
MMNTDTTVNDLAGWARAVARADSPADVFKTLLEASRSAAPRAAVFLVRQGELHGWGSAGHAPDAAQAQRAFRAPLDEGWLGEVARDPEGAPCPRPADASDPDFGQREATETVGCAVRIDDRPIALVVGERSSDEDPWLPDGLALLAAVARLRLELNLARRRAGTSVETGTATRPAPVPSEPASAEPDDEAVPNLEVARRYARLVATDIRLYNEEAVMLGRRNGDLAERLSEPIDRGREAFARRHGDLGPTGLELLHEAYVQVLAGGDAALIPSHVPK